MATSFAEVYNYFLGKITDDMYLELTPEDTLKDMQHLLLDSLPGFEFPRVNLYDYKIEIVAIAEDEVQVDDFVLGILWDEMTAPSPITEDDMVPMALVDRSTFNITLTPEEVNILALLMKQAWVQRQVTSIENTRMKYSSTDFKMTSQANHLSKLLSLLEESRRDSFHMQRLYKRRKVGSDGAYKSNWSVFREVSALGH